MIGDILTLPFWEGVLCGVVLSAVGYFYFKAKRLALRKKK